MKSFLFLLTLAPLFVQTYAGSSFQSTTVLDNNSTGPVELKLDDGQSKPKPMIAKKALSSDSFDRDTNSHNGTRTDLQPATVEPTQSKGDNLTSRAISLVSDTQIMDATIRTKANKDKVSFVSFDRYTNPHNGTGTDLQPATVQPTQIKGDNMPFRASSLDTDLKTIYATSTIATKKALASDAFDRDTNPHNNARTDLQPANVQPTQNDLKPATVQPTQIKGDNMPSRDIPLVSNMTIDATSMSTIANHATQANKDDVLISDSFDRGTNSLNVYSSKDHFFVVTITAATKEVSKDM